MPEPAGREIGRLRAGRDVLAIRVDGPDILIGQPDGWPIRLNASARSEFMRLFTAAERLIEVPGQAPEDDDGIWCGNPRECANGPADHPWHISCLLTPGRVASIRAWLEEPQP